MSNINDKVIAITGAGSGIGRALALQLTAKGARLALSDINPDSLQETARLCRSAAQAELTTRLLDVSDRKAVYAWAEEVYLHYGQVNVIINNAGIALSSTIEDLPYEDFEWLMNINFWGVVYGCKAFLPLLKQSGQGHIINISSLFGLIATPTTSAYNAAKFAVRGFTESLSQELAISQAGINVTCVHPGGIKTNIVSGGRVIPNADWGLVDTAQSSDRFQKIARTSPESAAQQIIAALENPRQRRLLIGKDAKMLDFVQRLMPVQYQSIVAHFAARHRGMH